MYFHAFLVFCPQEKEIFVFFFQIFFQPTSFPTNNNHNNNNNKMDGDKDETKKIQKGGLLEANPSPFLVQDQKKQTPQSLIQPVNASSSSSSPSSSFPLPPPDCGGLLARLEAFLPQMEEANNSLQKVIDEKGREAVDLEVVSDDAPQVIEMDLTLGVLEQKKEGEEEGEGEGAPPSPSSLLAGRMGKEKLVEEVGDMGEKSD